MKNDTSTITKKALYDQKIIGILSKENPSINDFAALSIVYSKIQTLNDEQFERLETKRILNYAKNNPKHTRMIMSIINQHRKQKEPKQTNSHIYSEIQSLITETTTALSGNVISETKIRDCYSRIQLKIRELSNMVHSLSENDYKHLIGLLYESMKQCEQTIKYCQEEHNIWTK